MDDFLSSLIASFSSTVHPIGIEVCNRKYPCELDQLSETELDLFLGFKHNELEEYKSDILFYSFFLLIKSTDSITQGLVKVELINSDFREIEVHCIGLNRASIASRRTYVCGMIYVLYFMVTRKLVHSVRARVKKHNKVSARFISSIGFENIRADEEFQYFYLASTKLLRVAHRLNLA